MVDLGLQERRRQQGGEIVDQLGHRCARVRVHP
jgi:hypothetical protein